MIAPVDGISLQVGSLAVGNPAKDDVDAAAQVSARPQAVDHETAPAADDKICWIEVRQSPYPPNQQVELLNLQAEAEALLLHLQSLRQRRQAHP